VFLTKPEMNRLRGLDRNIQPSPFLAMIRSHAIGKLRRDAAIEAATRNSQQCALSSRRSIESLSWSLDPDFGPSRASGPSDELRRAEGEREEPCDGSPGTRGKRDQRGPARDEGISAVWHGVSSAPTGLGIAGDPSHPPLKRWAIIGCACGTGPVLVLAFERVIVLMSLCREWTVWKRQTVRSIPGHKPE
jgi:hypothetical protein